jgi:hypothetical protein
MTGKVPVARAQGQELLPATIEGMDAIHNARAMNPEDSAGSPDADFAIVSRTASSRLARFFRLRGFCVLGATPFVNP